MILIFSVLERSKISFVYIYVPYHEKVLRLRGRSEVCHPPFGQEQQAVEHFENERARLMDRDHDGLVVPNRQIPAKLTTFVERAMQGIVTKVA